MLFWALEKLNLSFNKYNQIKYPRNRIAKLIIFMSGLFRQEIARNSRPNGYFGVILKPADGVLTTHPTLATNFNCNGKT